VGTSRCTPYHPERNGQCERANQTIWRKIKLFLHSQSLPEDRWAEVLPKALHAIRSLICVTTNETSHERLFSFPRRAMMGTSVPTWLMSPGPVLLRRFVRTKGEPLRDEVELLDANPTYAHVRYPEEMKVLFPLPISRLHNQSKVLTLRLLPMLFLRQISPFYQQRRQMSMLMRELFKAKTKPRT